ncbi:MAG: MmgE/PrpD family protein [Gaiellaceae bacterium]
MTTAAEQFAAFATTLTYDDVPSDVIEHAKDHLLDTYGCGLAASAMGVATEGRSTMRELGGIGDAVVIGQEEGMPGANAAFANAMLCHGLDFDDTHSDSVSHVSTVVCPAALATAQSKGASGTDLITAIVIGNEIVTRVGMATPGAFHKRGFHPTAICGIFGATAAVGRLLGNDAETITRALGIAGSMASGLFAYLTDGTPTKPIHPAWAAHGATIANQLAAFGAIGPKSVFEGKFGVYHAFLGVKEIDLDEQLSDLGERWETPRIAYKPYPACHFIHGSLGATASLAAGRTFTADEIDAITVRVPEAGVALVLEPETEKRAPRSEYEGKFSLQYSTAAMLGRGSVGVSDYTDEAIGDQSVLDIAAKVSYETKEYASYPSEGFPGGVEIKLANGDVLAAELEHQKGGPDNPMSREEVSAKYRLNGSLALDDADLDTLEANVIGIEEHSDLTAAFAPLASAASAPAGA